MIEYSRGAWTRLNDRRCLRNTHDHFCYSVIEHIGGLTIWKEHSYMRLDCNGKLRNTHWHCLLLDEYL